jgi:hypothetical protein
MNNTYLVNHKISESNYDYLVYVRAQSVSEEWENVITKYANIGFIFSLYGESQQDLNLDNLQLMYGGVNKYQAFKQISCHVSAKYVWFVDEDIVFDLDIPELFNFVDLNDLYMCHHSITENSHSRWKNLYYKQGSELRETDFVEVMCPIFSRKALSDMMFTFDESFSTWGLDHVWSYLRSQQFFVIDKFQVKHIDKPDTKNGAFYKYLKRNSINPYLESLYLRAKFISLKMIGALECYKRNKGKIEILFNLHCRGLLVKNRYDLNLLENYAYLYLNPHTLDTYQEREGVMYVLDGRYNSYFMSRYLKESYLPLNFDYGGIADYVISNTDLPIVFVGGTVSEISLFGNNFRINYPFKEVSFYDGFQEIDSVLENLKKRTLLVLSVGSPKQQKLIYSNSVNDLLIFSSGAFISQSARNADSFPGIIHRTGLQFIYRIFSEKNIFKRIISEYFPFWFISFLTPFRKYLKVV